MLDDDFAGPRAVDEETVDWPYQMLPKSRKGAAQRGWLLQPHAFIIALSALVMILLLLIPTWNTIALMQDPIFMYMAGYETTTWCLLCFVLLLFSWFIIISFLVERIRPEKRTEQNMLMISGIFLSTLGIMLILFGGPIGRQAEAAHADLMSNCKLGAKTQPLFVAFQELESLRATPSCAKLASIEDCTGFKSYSKMHLAMVLKEMETEFSCSGLCQVANATGAYTYPPTLFSQANSKVSCNGMAARRMLNFDAEVAFQMCSEGFMLVGTALVISLLQLIAFCSRSTSKEEGVSGKSYGAIL